MPAAGRGPGSGPVPTVSTGLTARLAEQEAARRRRRWTRLAITAAAAVVTAVLLWFVFLSPVFRLDTDLVEVTGEGTVIDPADVLAVVAEESEVPLTRLDTVSLRTRLLDVPGVRDVSIEREWPRGLAVELVSREPVAAVPEGGRFVLLDDEGVQVGRSGEVPENLPVIGLSLDNESRRTLEASLVLLNVLPPELHAQVEEVDADSPDTVQMTLRDGAVVLWGSSSDAELKLRVLEALRGAEQTKDAKVFDVSAPNAPIIR